MWGSDIINPAPDSQNIENNPAIRTFVVICLSISLFLLIPCRLVDG
jgi:hypothetical protein